MATLAKETIIVSASEVVVDLDALLLETQLPAGSESRDCLTLQQNQRSGLQQLVLVNSCAADANEEESAMVVIVVVVVVVAVLAIVAVIIFAVPQVRNKVFSFRKRAVESAQARVG
eukprot:TRINITY_DN9303_c0_g1_i1.p1 TRINITY_DN9303_c0_g1~~TRINITY_DN9303_c0_g1_i1.p1  ORF type:complete len:116 (-),score=23.08 TRINITY_DN9303_c0_g1_i1:20-367(-)